MKKYIYNLGVALLLCLQFSSCKLEQVTYDNINADVFPKNESDVRALVTSSAYYVFNPWGIFRFNSGYITSSEAVSDYFESFNRWTILYNSYEANDWYIDSDDRRNYDFIQFLSKMTLNIERIKGVDMDMELKNRYIAELKCGIGFLSFLLYDLYGPLPIPTLDVLQSPEKEIIVPRLSDEDMRKYIESHLKEAAEILPYKYDDTGYGRFTKGLANTLLLKFYMLTKQWDAAEQIGRELTTNKEYGYKLEEDYHKLFSMAGEKNPEVIYASPAKAGVMEQQWFSAALPADFPVPSGMNMTRWGILCMSWPAYESFEEGDKRKERIVAEYTGDTGVYHSKKEDRESGKVGLLYYGPVPQKYKIEATVGAGCEIDIPIYRYADVLTLLSEAIVRNKKEVTQEAVDLLNQVRTVHGGLQGYEMEDISSVEHFLDIMLEERGHEFYLEGVRRQDLIRHGRFIEKALEKARYAGQPTGKIETIVDGQYKYEKFPLPTHIITEGQGIIKQNPGY